MACVMRESLCLELSTFLQVQLWKGTWREHGATDTPERYEFIVVFSGAGWVY